MITSAINSIKSDNHAKEIFSRSNIVVKDTVDSLFASNVIEQFNNLTSAFGDNGIDKLVILKSVQDAEELQDFCPELHKKLLGEASVAYGIYDNKDKTICIIQDNHKRKDEKYEGSMSEQGSDTLTHEFGHLLDKKYSKSDGFKSAYKKDLIEFDRNLKKNPNKKIEGSDMSYLEAKDYFKHYIEGADFSDGIDDNDVTRTGHREQWAEAFSIAFDNSENEANRIHKALFKNTYNRFLDIMQTA